MGIELTEQQAKKLNLALMGKKVELDENEVTLLNRALAEQKQQTKPVTKKAMSLDIVKEYAKRSIRSLPILGPASRMKPEEALEALPGTMATFAGVPSGGTLAVPAAMLGKGLEIAGKRAIGSESSTQPLIPFTKKPIPRIPGIKPELSDMVVEGSTQGAFELPGLGIKLGEKGLKEISKTQAFKAFGFGKIKDPKIRKEAMEASETALNHDILSVTKSPQQMREELLFKKEQVGEALGGYLKNLEGGFDIQIAINELEKLRPAFKGGIWNKMHSQIDNAIETLEGVKKINRVTDWQVANKIKGVFQDMANWKTNKDATVLDQKIAYTIRNALDISLDMTAKVGKKTKDFVSFMKNKKIYKDFEMIDDALNNRIGKELAQQSVTLSDAILLSTFLANPGGAAGLGWAAFRALKPKYNQIMAKGAQQVLKKENRIAPALRAVQ